MYLVAIYIKNLHKPQKIFNNFKDFDQKYDYIFLKIRHISDHENKILS